MNPQRAVIEDDDDNTGDEVVRRSREETAPRQHAFLRQTLPPEDPHVRESERLRSGQDSD
ncbi:MAG: hypothetical protein K0V04_22260 [Deltaproteobacteria bacterium]|nr:hypothetical protein [Deltaproteobacteria bacterium]